MKIFQGLERANQQEQQSFCLDIMGVYFKGLEGAMAPRPPSPWISACTVLVFSVNMISKHDIFLVCDCDFIDFEAI